MTRLVQTTCFLFALAFLSTAAGSSASAASRIPQRELTDCQELLPAVLRIAVPHRAAPASDLRGVRRQVEQALRPFLNDRSQLLQGGSFDCRGDRRIQINIAIGSDYEILDWLSEGEVDGALAAPLSLWLLDRDGTRVVEVDRSAFPANNPQAQFAAGRHKRNSEGGSWINDPDPEGVLEIYRESLFCKALASCDEAEFVAAMDLGLCDSHRETFDLGPIRPVMPDHLSTSGFVLPMSSNSIWLERRIARLRENLTEKDNGWGLSPKIRDAFWRGWMKDLRFSLDHDPFDRMKPQSQSGDPASATRPLDLNEGQETSLEILFSGFPPSPGLREKILSPDPYEASLFPDSNASLIVQDRWILLHGALEDRLREYSQVFRGVVKVQRVPPGFKAALEPRAFRESGTVEVLALPPELRSLLEVNPRFGVRSMAFTPDETLRLLHAQKTVHEGPSARLSLILPGGGVKSAYQAVLLDRLYGSGSLRNFLVEEAPDLGQRPLDVHQVIGTSGGALTGYFVAQLGSRGPWNLTELLWHQGPRDGAPPLEPGEKSPPLRSKDIFGFTDLLRYLSIVLNLLVFCILLVFVVHSEKLRGHHRSVGAPAGRFRVTLILWGVLLATPLVLQIASAGGDREHVPEIEGVAYLLLVLLVMMADQCIVSRDDRPSEKFWIPWRIPVIAGSFLLLIPVGTQLFLAFQTRGADLKPSQTTEKLSLLLAGTSANVGLVYFLLTVFGILGAMAIPLRRLHASWTGGMRSVAAAALDALLCSTLALTLFSSQTVRARIGWNPPLLLSVLVVLVLAILLLAALRPIMKREGRAGWIPYYLSLFSVSVVVFFLCLPESPGSYDSILSVLLAPSGLDVFGGHLMVMLGSLLLAAGLIQAVIQGQNSYRLEGETRFMRGLFLLLAHAVGVLLVMFFLDWLMTQVSGSFVLPITTLELDWRYWAVSITIAALYGIFLLGLRKRAVWRPVMKFLRGPRIEGTGSDDTQSESPSQLRQLLAQARRLHAIAFLRGLRMLRHSALFLLESHPNRPLIAVRAFRMLMVGAGAVLWWNLLLAPAAYGNKEAEKTLHKTITRFENAYEQAHLTGLAENRRPYERADTLKPRFRAHFVSPANELQEDGTRFFLFSPQEAEECPEVPERSRSGSQWFSYRVFEGAVAQQRALVGGLSFPCDPLDSDSDAGKEFLTSVIFASGSPFPIFAPHRVQAPGDDKEAMILVDGGYSNNVPVEAALELGARQVLILRSAHPSPDRKEGRMGQVIAKILGPLVRNLPRIPAFLFERSQQVDRLSSQNVFVVSLAPLPGHQKWPALFHFQKDVVERLETVAEEDMQERIGFVESWGRPETRLSLAFESLTSESLPETVGSL